MSNALYNDVAQIADDLFTEFGQKVTIVSKGKRDYDPAIGGAAPSSTTTQTTQGFEMSYASHEVNGTSVLATDIKVYLSPVGITEPLHGDQLSLEDGRKFKVQHVMATRPAGQTVLYEVQARV
jgi:hypothetical protein